MKPPLEIAREIWRGQPVEEWADALAAIPEKRDGLLLRHAVRQCLRVMQRWRLEDGVLVSSTVPKWPEK